MHVHAHVQAHATASKNRTFAIADENERRKAFDLPAQPNASSRSTPTSIITSPPDAIANQVSSIVTVVIKLSQRGALPSAPLPDGILRWAESVPQSSL